MQIDTMNKEQSGDTYIYLKVKVQKDCFILPNNVESLLDPDEMPHTIWGFTVCQSICILVSQNSKV